MTGRNSHPDGNGVAASPSRLDQFGEKQVERDKQKMKQEFKKNECK